MPLLAIAVLLTALFVTLKLAGLVAWPWLAATAPAWIYLGLVVFVLLWIELLVGSVIRRRWARR